MPGDRHLTDVELAAGQYAYLFRLQAEGYGDVGAAAPAKASP
jgi:hypothetical protein